MDKLPSLPVSKSSHSESPNDKYATRSKNAITVLCLLALSLASVSIYLSYFTAQSPAWTAAFGPYGWTIELTRSILWVGCAYFLLGHLRHRETLILFGYRRFHESEKMPYNYKLLNASRFFFAFLVSLFAFVLLYQHFYYGPSWLKGQYTSTGSLLLRHSGFRLYNLPYLLYFPYSVVNYLVIGGSLVSVGFFSALRDLIASAYSRASLLDNIANLAEDLKPLGDHAEHDKHCSCILRLFEAYAFRLMEVVSGYSSFVLVFVAMTTFEFHVGRRVLSDFGWTLSLIGYSLITLSFAIIFLCFFSYSNVYHECSKSLFEYGCKGYRDFEKENSFTLFFQRLLRRDLTLYISLFILTFFSPVGDSVGRFIGGKFLGS